MDFQPAPLVGGEEIQAVQAAGIAFIIVPGVTSVTGVAAYAGIPLTHRDLSSTFSVITGSNEKKQGDIHIDWKKGKRVPGLVIDAETVRKMDLTPRSITAVLVGLKSRLSAFTAIREINNFRSEPLLAILPGVALQELWGLMGTAEVALELSVRLFVAPFPSKDKFHLSAPAS